jgi:hypothetical protein
LCRRLGGIADGCLFGDARLEDAAEVGNAKQKDHQERQDQAKLDKRLAALGA